MLVPTGGAALELRRTLERRRTRPLLSMLPDVLTRAGFYERLHEGARFPPLLTAQAREVLLRRAARAVALRVAPPFSLRPGLILEMLAFYDELRRREQSLDDFNRKVTAQLAPGADTDRGAERLLRQTEFLAAAFAEFEHLSSNTEAVDEHGLRTLLLAEGGRERYAQVIVTVGDQAADPRGLFASDFDLLARLRGVERLDVIATENLLASGFHERIHDLLPGIEEERLADEPVSRPTLVAPQPGDEDRRWFICRDREEELADFIRDLNQRPGASEARCAIVFQRPLPYVYLAPQLFAGAGISYQTAAERPLSAEPFAAAIDLVLTFLSAEGNRASTIALLSSPQFTFPCDSASVAALDRRMLEVKFSGGWDRLDDLTVPPAAAAALTAVRSAAADLALVPTADSSAAQFDGVLAFLVKFEKAPPDDAPWRERHARARAQVVSAIEAMRQAHESHDHEPLNLDDLAGAVRRWIDAQTFAPSTSEAGVRLIDAASAPYADVDELRIVGLVEADWPEPAERSIFYPAAILAQLGYPSDAPRSSAARARFRDLIALPHERISASSFTLEDDAIVAASAFVEELDVAGLPVERRPALSTRPAFLHERLAAETPDAAAIDDLYPAEWLQLRTSRTSADNPRYQGITGPRPSKTYAVSQVERYLECPFKYLRVAGAAPSRRARR